MTTLIRRSYAYGLPRFPEHALVTISLRLAGRETISTIFTCHCSSPEHVFVTAKASIIAKKANNAWRDSMTTALSKLFSGCVY